MHTDMPGFNKCQRLPSDRQQISRYLTSPHLGNQKELFVLNQSSLTLKLKVPGWRTWAYPASDGRCQ
eukprot:221668-Pelagomonas_calceolata.AAC.1